MPKQAIAGHSTSFVGAWHEHTILIFGQDLRHNQTTVFETLFLSKTYKPQSQTEHNFPGQSIKEGEKIMIANLIPHHY